ncbi:hypothetical protein ACP4TB_30435 [Streptomyces sp. DR3-1]|uniref:hypothetical protein n=1 Tax=Streptomyces sp. DR3-1 TaxID=2951169 RepID=UPI002044B154|nr:hypothetical protein [Streptomyces sp. DR3-1]MCM3822591.1 hypothetical protein [Streptomyces sp. DR3-1]
MPEPLTVTEDQVRALRAALDALLPDERITQLTDERDRARRWAVGLEQENAELTRRLAAAETDLDREVVRRASDDSSDWDDATWAAWWRIAERAHARSITCNCGTPGGDS